MGLGDDGPPVLLSPRSADRAHALAERFAGASVADSNQRVLDAADLVLLCVRPQDAEAVLADLSFRTGQAVISVVAGLEMEALRLHVAPAQTLARAIPLPAVATRSGLTPIHPADPRTREFFERIGDVIEIDDEDTFDALAAASATIASHLSYLDTIARWLARRGLPDADAARYVGATFGGLAETLPQATDFNALATEFATKGGLNEQVLATLRVAGVFSAVDAALDDIARRLRSSD